MLPVAGLLPRAGRGRPAAAARPTPTTTSPSTVLAGMGFSEAQARQALQAAGGDMEAALDWLIDNCV